jgi:hypothetical protein
MPVAAGGRMSVSFKRRGAVDPWRGRQPKYERLVAGQAADRYALATRLPSGEEILVWLGRSPEPPALTEGCASS